MQSPRQRINDKRARKAMLLNAAITVAKRSHFGALTRDAVAAEAGVSPASIGHTCGTMTEFRRDIMRYAVQHKIVEVVAHGLAANHPAALNAPPELKQLASQYLAGV